MGATLSEIILVAVLALPIVIALMRSRDIDVDAFVFNAGGNSLLKATASVVCSNVGIGTFVAIFLFTKASPVIGVSIVAAATLGLLLCAVLAPRIHDISRRTGTYGLVDLIVVTHGVSRPILVWLPVAVVFVLRIMIQLIALGLILGEAFGLSPLVALAAATLFSSLYVIIGGYRAATETDLFHAVVIVAAMAFVAFALPQGAQGGRDFLDLGPYQPVLLMGVFLFLPFSAVLGIDNWQRMSTAQSATVARRAYVAGTVICGAIYAAIAAAALLPGTQDDVLASFRGLMPAGAPWLAEALFASAIISSIDTFMVPLTSTFARQGLDLRQLRLLVVGLFVLIAVLAALIGDILSSVIAAFNSLVVFLPAVCGAMLLKNPRPEAATVSMSVGVAATLLLTSVDQNSAAPIGFAISTLAYWLIQRRPAASKAG